MCSFDWRLGFVAVRSDFTGGSLTLTGSGVAECSSRTAVSAALPQDDGRDDQTRGFNDGAGILKQGCGARRCGVEDNVSCNTGGLDEQRSASDSVKIHKTWPTRD